jgi:hypothetical protein
MAVLFSSALCLVASAAEAAPVRGAAVVARTVTPSRTTAAGSHGVGLLRSFAGVRMPARQAAPATIVALPLSAPSGKRLSPLFAPQVMFEQMIPAVLGSDGCDATRASALLATLPAPEFTPRVCRRDLPADVSVGSTALVPGRNKNALYGPAFQPHDFGTP